MYGWDLLGSVTLSTWASDDSLNRMGTRSWCLPRPILSNFEGKDSHVPRAACFNPAYSLRVLCNTYSFQLLLAHLPNRSLKSRSRAELWWIQCFVAQLCARSWWDGVPFGFLNILMYSIDKRNECKKGSNCNIWIARIKGICSSHVPPDLILRAIIIQALSPCPARLQNRFGMSSISCFVYVVSYVVAIGASL